MILLATVFSAAASLISSAHALPFMGSSQALSIIGPSTATEVPESLCIIKRLQVSISGQPPVDVNGAFDESKISDEVRNSSGTLTATGEVTTAAHNLDASLSKDAVTGDFFYRVGCGVSRGDSGKMTVKRWSWARSARWVSAYGRDGLGGPGTDLAKLQLETPITDIPIMPLGTRGAFKTLSDRAECRIAGIGMNWVSTRLTPVSGTINLERLQLAGKVVTYSDVVLMPTADSPRVREFLDFPRFKTGGTPLDLTTILSDVRLAARFEAWYRGIFSGSFTAPGDSGGPMYCRESANEPWKLYAVANTTAIGYNTTRAPNGFHSSASWTLVDQPAQSTVRFFVPSLPRTTQTTDSKK